MPKFLCYRLNYLLEATDRQHLPECLSTPSFSRQQGTTHTYAVVEFYQRQAAVLNTGSRAVTVCYGFLHLTNNNLQPKRIYVAWRQVMQMLLY